MTARTAARELRRTLEEADRAAARGDREGEERASRRVLALERLLERLVPSPWRNPLRGWSGMWRRIAAARNPARSVAQRRLFAMALAHARGELPLSRLPPGVVGAVRRLAREVREEKLREFAKTRESGLPRRVRRRVRR